MLSGIVRAAVVVMLALCFDADSATMAETFDTCNPPSLLDCFYHILTAPINETFPLYCVVSSAENDGPLSFQWHEIDSEVHNNSIVTASGTGYYKNVSILIVSIQPGDAGLYVLQTMNDCGQTNASVLVMTREGNCNGYDYPNATHIQIPPSGMAYEGIPFSLRCLYNGDTDSNEYMLAWNKDDLKDITIGSIGKYLESADSDCNAGEPCCSFSDHLTVFNVSIKDSGLYSCVASSEAGGDAPFGASKSAYIVVAPFPSILTAPSGLNARNGSEVVLSCQVSGFSNATRVVWERNGKVVNTSFGGKYSTRRKTVGEEFMEHLTFMVKPTLAGNYSCCVGWSEGSGLSGEVVCSASNGTVTVYFAGNRQASIYMYTGIAVGVVILGGILIIVAVIVMVAVYRRKCHNSGYQRVMSEENHSINHYGAIPKATPAQRLRNPLGDSMPSSREEIVREVVPKVFIVYALEVGKKSEMLTAQSPTYRLVLDLLRVLEALGVECYHDSQLQCHGNRKSNYDLSVVLERSIEQSQVVLVVWSEVMKAAIRGSGHVQTRFGTFKSIVLKQLIKNNPRKFIPVSLSTEAPTLSGSPFRDAHSFCVGASLQPLMEGVASGSELQAMLASGTHSELQQLIATLQTVH